MSFRQRFDNTQETSASRDRDLEWLQQFQYRSEASVRAAFSNEDNLFRFFITLGRHENPINFINSNPEIFNILQTMIDQDFWFQQKQAELEKNRNFVLPPRDITNQEKDPAPIARSIISKRDALLTSHKKSQYDSLEAQLVTSLRRMSNYELAEFMRSPESHPDYPKFRAIADGAVEQENPTAHQYICYALICGDINKIDHALLRECVSLIEIELGENVAASLNFTAEVVEKNNTGFFAMIQQEHERRARDGNYSASSIPANFSGVVLREIDASKFDWGANLRSFNLSGASLLNCKFQHSDLRGANLSGALLENVDLTGANLSGAILTNVKVGAGVIIDNPTLFSVEQGITSPEEAQKRIESFRQLKIPDNVIADQFNRYIADLPAKDAAKASVLADLSKVMFEKVAKKLPPGKAASDQTDYRGKNVTAATEEGSKKKKSFLSSLSLLRRKDAKDKVDPSLDKTNHLNKGNKKF